MSNNTVNPAAHPNVTQTTPFTPAEVTDIRRYCGFPASAAFGYVYGAGGMSNMDIQIANMSDQEQAVVRTVYLPNLATMETAIFASGDNLDTDVAAVWTHNKNELADRMALFNTTRRQLCGFIGVAPGAALGDGRNRLLRG